METIFGTILGLLYRWRPLVEEFLHLEVREFLAAVLHDLSGQDLKATPFEEGLRCDACLRKKSRKALTAGRSLETSEQGRGNTATFVLRMHIHSVEVS